MRSQQEIERYYFERLDNPRLPHMVDAAGRRTRFVPLQMAARSRRALPHRTGPAIPGIASWAASDAAGAAA
jgi:hypothetical protein